MDNELRWDQILSCYLRTTDLEDDFYKHRLLLARLKGQICDDSRRRSVVRPLVISRKLSKIDTWLLWNTIKKSASLILLPHLDPPNGFKYKMRANVNTPSWLASTTVVVNQRGRHFTARVVNCCKRSATVGICCSRSSSVVLTNDDAELEQQAGKLLFAVNITLSFVGCIKNLGSSFPVSLWSHFSYRPSPSFTIHFSSFHPPFFSLASFPAVSSLKCNLGGL